MTAADPAALRLLAFDDEPPALNELAYLLRADPRVAEVRTAGEAVTALRVLEESTVDGVFLDIRMPGLSGLELARLLGRFATPPPVVFVTAYDDAAVDRGVLAARGGLSAQAGARGAAGRGGRPGAGRARPGAGRPPPGRPPVGSSPAGPDTGRGRCRRQPGPQPRHLRRLRGRHAGAGPQGQQDQQKRVRHVHRGRRLLRPAERCRHLRRLPVRRVLWALTRFGFNFSELLGQGAAAGAQLEPGKQYGLSQVTRLDFISLSLALVLGTAGLPHIPMRFYTVPTAKEARKSVVWAIWLIGLFYLFYLSLGYGAAALVGPERIAAAPGRANSAAPLLAFELGGTLLLGVISAFAFATILAVVAGLTITASASFAHDIYAQVIKRGNPRPEAEVKVARIAAIVVGAVAILGGIAANGQNIAFLVALAFAVAASANLPTILYSLFWKRFNTRGCLFSIYGSLIITITLIVSSPAVSGTPQIFNRTNERLSAERNILCGARYRR